MDPKVFENPSSTRDIIDGLVHFPGLQYTRWRVYRDGNFVAIAQSEAQARVRWAAAAEPHNTLGSFRLGVQPH